MENNTQEKEGFSLLDILRLLWSKVLILILTLIVGGIAGVGFAVIKTINVDYWGTTVEFYVNPEKPKKPTGNGSQYGVYGAYGRHVMDNMIKLLESESFTERLMLNGAELPVASEWVDTENPDEVALNLDEKVSAAETSIILSTAVQDVAQRQSLIASENYSALQNAWSAAIINSKYSQYTTYNKNLYSQILSDLHSIGVNTDELETCYMAYEGIFDSKTASATMKELADILSATSQDYLPALRTKLEQAQQIVNENERAKAVETAYKHYFDSVMSVFDDHKDNLGSKNVAETVLSVSTLVQEWEKESISIAFESWSHTESYKEKLKQYSESISFSYLEEVEDLDTANNLARSFIYVEISVLNDEAFANQLLDCVKNVVPVYVKENMAIPADYEGTNCQRITRTDNIILTNEDYTMTESIKFGLLFAAASLLIAAVIIIFVDKSDKRLRDCEVITKQFNVPVLGVVPTIDSLVEESQAKVKRNRANEKKSGKEVK